MAKAVKKTSSAASSKQISVRKKIGELNRQALVEAYKAGKAGKLLPPSTTIYKKAAQAVF